MTQFTRHAARRASQRGVTHEAVAALIAHADFEASVGRGCSVVRFTRERLADRDLRATLGPLADRVRSLALVVADDTGEVVTVLHDYGRAKDRRYRRAA